MKTAAFPTGSTINVSIVPCAQTILAALGILLLVFTATTSAAPSAVPKISAEKVASIRTAAEQGDVSAQVKLGECYATGQRVAKDLAEAVKWYRKAAEQGDATAEYNLGNCCAFGEGVPQDYAEAAKWYLKAAAKGDRSAQSEIGFYYVNGRGGLPVDAAEGVKWYRKAAEQGSSYAQLQLGRIYFNGEGQPKDVVEAMKWYRLAGEQNESYAQLQLGEYFFELGVDMDKNAVEAAEWYGKAAEQGNAKAQRMLGVCYGMGKGVAKNATTAVEWFRKAAEKGNADAQLNMGFVYRFGFGVRQDHVESIKWFRKAAEQGDAKAQYNLGLAYRTGRGVKQDHKEAANWHRKSAEQGFPTAQADLGVSYASGQGVAKDFAEAVKWLGKAAEQGDAAAQCNLGICYSGGDGVVKDEVEAYKWWLLAAGQGYVDAKTNVEGSEKRLTREQIAEGQKLARNFKPRKGPEVGAHLSSDQVADSRPAGTGTGFFITEDGFLITNHHVVKDANQVRLATSAGLIAARVVKVDPVNDLALLKAEGKFFALPVTASRSVRLGNSVATVGFPNIGLQGFAPKLAKGEIAALSGAADDTRYFQISVPLQPGNSGGALVDERGNVVGVVAGKLNVAAALSAGGELPENVNYAVKSSFLLGFLEAVPNVSNALKEPNSKEEKFENVVRSAEQGAVLVLVY